MVILRKRQLAHDMDNADAVDLLQFEFALELFTMGDGEQLKGEIKSCKAAHEQASDFVKDVNTVEALIVNLFSLDPHCTNLLRDVRGVRVQTL